MLTHMQCNNSIYCRIATHINCGKCGHLLRHTPHFWPTVSTANQLTLRSISFSPEVCLPALGNWIADEQTNRLEMLLDAKIQRKRCKATHKCIGKHSTGNYYCTRSTRFKTQMLKQNKTKEQQNLFRAIFCINRATCLLAYLSAAFVL